MEINAKGLALGRRIRHVGRLAQIANVFARHGLWTLAERIGLPTWLTPEQVAEAKELHARGGVDAAEGLPEAQQEAAEGINGGFLDSTVKGLPARLRRSFEELGPAFIKLGQVLAVREDILPKEYVDELCKLHHHVQALPYATIRTVLEQELGPEKLAQFSEIQEKPVAAGSIAQVHEARLVSGERVVLKVQRPGIEQQIRVDLSLMEEIVNLVERYFTETSSARPRAMIAEFSRGLLGELDFIREAGNITKMRRNLASMEHITLPEVHWQLSTGRVLTQTFLEGLPAWDRERIVNAGLDPSLLVERGLVMFLKMVFVDGLYHGDLHPGNLLAMPNNCVGVLDFGLSVHLGRTTREHLAGLLMALIEEDYQRVVMHYCEIAEPEIGFNQEAFEYDVGNAVSPFIGLSLEDMRTGRLFWDVARVAAKHGAPMPQELVIFVKTLVSFEGIGTHLAPGFDILASAERFSAEIVREIYSPDNLKQQAMVIARDLGQLAKHAPLSIRRLLRAALEGDLSVKVKADDLARLAGALERASARMAISMIIAALIIGTSILTFSRVGAELTSIPIYGILGFAMAGLLGFYIIWSILRGGN